MSNKKVFLYDNGLVSAASYSPFEDRGKLMENLVFPISAAAPKTSFHEKRLGMRLPYLSER